MEKQQQQQQICVNTHQGIRKVRVSLIYVNSVINLFLWVWLCQSGRLPHLVVTAAIGNLHSGSPMMMAPLAHTVSTNQIQRFSDDRGRVEAIIMEKITLQSLISTMIRSLTV
ncbi:hypothetical protein GQX74_003330 [Glossina fuscipes]|nr:hypothetical protein GQX74_003330 [Glossina fuscipes]